jgi:hypothetical protein
MLDLSPDVEARLTRVAQFYQLSPERYCEIILNRAFQRLVDDSPNLSHLVDLP